MSALRTRRSPTRTSLRVELPTLEEAIFAAQGLTDDLAGQTQIAAMLMGLPEAEVRAAILKSAASAARAPRLLPRVSPSGTRRPVIVVEKRAPRALMR